VDVPLRVKGDITVSHLYDTTARFADPGSALNRVVRLAGKNRRVLDVGCGPGTTASALVANGCTVTAVDNDPSALSLAARYATTTCRVDLDREDWGGELAPNQRFDAIVLADVLEHLRDPVRTLKTATQFLSEDGNVVISLPNAGHNAVLALLWLGDFQYRDIGLLDRTHVRFFCAANIEPLLSSAGLTLQHVEFVMTHPRDSEYAEEWYQLPGRVRRALRSNRYGSVYQFVLAARRRSAANAVLRLDDVAVPPLPDSPLIDLRRAVGRIARRIGLLAERT